jgi:NCS2 family nucleobase:cation symporter-2
MNKKRNTEQKLYKPEQSLSKKPSNIIFDVNERPPLITTILQGIQHASIYFISLIFPVLIVKQMGLGISPGDASSFISLSILAGAITSILQALRKGPLGSGYLCPSVCGPSYFDATKIAVTSGGLPLVFGMTALAGAIEMGFSRIMRRLRVLFPSEVTGVAVTMVGIVLVPISVNNFLAIHEKNIIGTPAELSVGIFTLLTMIILNVFGKGKLRLYCALIGLMVGYLAALLLGLIPTSDIDKIGGAPFFRMPYIRHMRWAFDFSLLIPFMVATICSTLKTVGDLVTCQKINDADWRAPEMKSISNGIFVDGIGGVLPGLMGGFGQSTSSTNVGLSLATGVTSRAVAFSLGGVLGILAFLPKFSMLFLIMPKPVMGAVLLFAACFMIISGLQIITSRMLDARKIFIVGISLIMGLSVDMLPGIYDHFHPWIRPMFESSLALATILAVLLNLIMRIGISKKRSIKLPAMSNSNQKLFDFMDQNGRAWGALQTVIDKAKNAIIEFNVALMLSGHKESPVKYEASFDELNLNIDIHYHGKLLSPSENVDIDWAQAGEEEFQKLALYLVYYYADKVTSSCKNDICCYRLHFDH